MLYSYVLFTLSTVLFATLTNSQQSIAGCSTVVASCGSRCFCKDVITRSNEEAEECHMCMAAGYRGCFCPQGSAWHDLERRRCISFEDCRNQPKGSGEMPQQPARKGYKYLKYRNIEEHQPVRFRNRKPVRSRYFDYDSVEYGPNAWGKHFSHCQGSQQSPIDLPHESDLIVDDSMADLYLKAYNRYIPGYALTNTGHSAQVTVPGHPEILINDGRGNQYKLLQFHFHWGRNQNEGSEHRIQGKAYPAEIHFLHLLVSRGPTNAMKYLTIAVLLEISDSENEALNLIIEKLPRIKYPKSTTAIDYPLSLQEFLPDDISSYYRYNGSLSIPPCYETVEYNVFKKPSKISHGQLKILSKSLLKESRQHISSPHQPTAILEQNFRPTLPINGRIVFLKRHSDLPVPSILASPQSASAYPSTRVSLQRGFVTAIYTLSKLEGNCKEACYELQRLACDYLEFDALQYNTLKHIISDLGGLCYDEEFNDNKLTTAFDSSARALRCEDNDGVFISLQSSCTEPGDDYRRICQCI